MSYSDRDRYRAELNAILRVADDEGMVQLLWAVNILQSEQSASAHKALGEWPIGADCVDLTARFAIRKWDIEDLVNELFSISKRHPSGESRSREMDYRHFGNAYQLAEVLQKLHGAEDGIGLQSISVLDEIKRLSARQFEWQRGFLNHASLYRSAFIYGHGSPADYFQNTHGLSVNQFSLIGFGLASSLMTDPSVSTDMNWAEIGLSPAVRDSAMSLLTISDSQARKLATEYRRRPGHSAYKQSFLRRFPCITFREEQIRCPLPQLIWERTSSGIFYDVIGGGGAVRNYCGHRFEQYCLDILIAMLKELSFEPEWEYRVSK